MNVATTPNASSILSKERLDLRCMAEVSRVHTRLNIMAWHYGKGKLMPGKSLRVIVYCLCEMPLQG